MTKATQCNVTAAGPFAPCHNAATRVRVTSGGCRVILCGKHDQRYGQIIGTLVTVERTIVGGSPNPTEIVITEPQRPDAG